LNRSYLFLAREAYRFDHMQKVYLVSSLVHAILAIVIVSIPDSPLLTITSRRQFDDWSPLLDLYRNIQSFNDTSTLSKSLSLSWCNATLPPNTVRAPYCRCVERTHDTFKKSSNKTLQVAKEEANMNLVGCLGERPVWRITPIWGLRFTTPAVYVLFIAASFLWIAADLDAKYSTVPIWILTFALVISILVQDYIHNSFWAFTFVLVAVIINLILLPGMAMPLPEPAATSASNMLQTSPNAILDRTPSCFWWTEYLTAPVFALYIPLMHCGRDIFFASVFTMIGTAVGGLGLRSFWCSQAYSDKPKEQFMPVMQYIVWLGILASCVSLSFMTGVYYNSDVPYSMGPGSVALMVLTFCISLLQWPGNQNFRQLLFTQMSLAFVRNVVFFSLIVSDVL
jgi:hypothetical protein